MKKISNGAGSGPSDIRLRHELLRNEYQALKRKLESKNDALQILNQNLSECQRERDEFQMMADQLRNRCQTMKKQLQIDQKISSTLFPSCDTMIVSGPNEVEDLKQKLADAEGDIKLLREKIIKHRLGTAEQQKTTRKSLTADERDTLIKELEKSKDSYSQLEQDIKQLLDMKEELETERDTYKSKYNRLNKEVNFIMRGDEKHVVDIDAMIMENKFLQQRVKQLQEENAAATTSLMKYRHLVEKRKPGAGILKSTTNHVIGGLLISQRQVKQLLASTETSDNGPSPQVVTDLKNLAASLLETINDKNLALNHQRKSNKLLGSRITDLENKLHQLELSAVETYNLRDKLQSLCELRGDCADIRSLIPQISLESSEIDPTDDSTSRHSQQTDHSDNSGSTSEDLSKFAVIDATNDHGENTKNIDNPECDVEGSLLDFSTPLKAICDEYKQLGDILNSEEEGDDLVTSPCTSECVSLDTQLGDCNTKATKDVCFVIPLQKLVSSSGNCNNSDMQKGATSSVNNSYQTERVKLSDSKHTSYSSMQLTPGSISPAGNTRHSDCEEGSLRLEAETDTHIALESSEYACRSAQAQQASSVQHEEDNINSTKVCSKADTHNNRLVSDTHDFWNAAIKRKMSAYSDDFDGNFCEDQDASNTITISNEAGSTDDNSVYQLSTDKQKSSQLHSSPAQNLSETHDSPAEVKEISQAYSRLDAISAAASEMPQTELPLTELTNVSPDWRSATDFQLPPIQTITDDIPHLDIDLSLANSNNSNNTSSSDEDIKRKSNGGLVPGIKVTVQDSIPESPCRDQKHIEGESKQVIRSDLLD